MQASGVVVHFGNNRRREPAEYREDARMSKQILFYPSAFGDEGREDTFDDDMQKLENLSSLRQQQP